MILKQEQIQKELETLIEDGNKVLETKFTRNCYGTMYAYVSLEQYTPWWSKARSFLCLFLPQNNTFLSQFDSNQKNNFYNAKICISLLESVNEQVKKGFINSEPKREDVSEVLESVFTHFHKVARQLRTRHSNRETIEVNDEYV